MRLTWTAEVFHRTTRILSPDGSNPRNTLEPYFGYWHPAARFIKYKTQGRSNGFICFLRRGLVGTGLFLAQRAEMAASGLRFDILDRRAALPRTEDNTLSERPYQNDCVAAMLKVRSGGLIVAGTGVGKTYIAGLYFRKLAAPAVFVVDERTLLYQAREEIGAVLGEPVGLIGDSEFEPQRVSVATVQTLGARLDDKRFRSWYSGLGAMVIDEVHLALNKRQEAIIQEIAPKVVLGLTATLQLEDQAVWFAAHNLCGPVIYRYAYEKGVKQGFLSKGVVVRVACKQATPVHVPPVKRKLRYHADYLALIVRSAKRNQRGLALVSSLLERRKPVLLLARRVGHIEHLAKECRRLGWKIGIAYGKVDVPDRRIACAEFEAGTIQLLLANQVFQKGINLRRVGAIVDLSATKSRNDAMQKFGRATRLSAGKRGFVYYDICDEGNRFEDAAKERSLEFKAQGVRCFYVPDEKFDAGRIVARSLGKI